MFVPFLSTNLDFNRFFPVQHKKTDNYFILNVVENRDFDEAANHEKFICYAIPKDGKTDTVPRFIF